MLDVTWLMQQLSLGVSTLLFILLIRSFQNLYLMLIKLLLMKIKNIPSDEVNNPPFIVRSNNKCKVQ